MAMTPINKNSIKVRNTIKIFQYYLTKNHWANTEQFT